MQSAMWQVLGLGLLTLSLLINSAEADPCTVCIGEGHHWCVDTSKCSSITRDCNTTIKNALNCPQPPKAGYEYTDDFGRNVAMPIIVAAGIPDPMVCLKNAMPTVTLDKVHRSQCSEIGPNTTCHAYTAYDTTNKLIIISFGGTEGYIQLAEEFESFLNKKEPFFDNGHVFKFFYDAFVFMWQQGMESAVRTLKYKYPDYDVWVMGHSLGGALASVCASYMMKLGLCTPEHTKLLTFGQPRTGDRNWTQWHDSQFFFSYRLVHHKDMVPHIPPLGGKDEVWHHRYEVWYNNKMAVGDPFQVCNEDDGRYCSNLQVDLNNADHLTYFRDDMYQWAAAGCPKDQ